MSDHETTHECPPEGSGLMPCCGRTPFEVPRTDRMTADAALVDCAGGSPVNDIDLDAQAERDAADIRAPWAGYQWKVRELIDRAQAAEADWARSQAEVHTLQADNDEWVRVVNVWRRRTYDAEARVAVLEAGIEQIATTLHEDIDYADIRGALLALRWLRDGDLNDDDVERARSIMENTNDNE